MTNAELAHYFATKRRSLQEAGRRCDNAKWERHRADDELAARQRAMEAARAAPAVREERNQHLQNWGMGS